MLTAARDSFMPHVHIFILDRNELVETNIWGPDNLFIDAIGRTPTSLRVVNLKVKSAHGANEPAEHPLTSILPLVFVIRPPPERRITSKAFSGQS